MLPETVSRCLVNQQRQYPEQSHNHQNVHSDSRTPPAGFIRENQGPTENVQFKANPGFTAAILARKAHAALKNN